MKKIISETVKYKTIDGDIVNTPEQALVNDLFCIDDCTVNEFDFAEMVKESMIQYRNIKNNSEQSHKNIIEKLKTLASSYNDANENDYCTFGECEGEQPSEIIGRMILIIQSI